MCHVSIVTATFNSELFIQQTYNSIIAQSVSDWEWLVTDDCSTDDTVNILQQIAAKDKRVKVFQNDVNSGAAVSRNNSIRHSTGKFIAFVDSDDLWLPDKLERQINFMSNLIDFSFTAYELIDEFGKPLNKIVDSRQAEALSYNDMLKKKATLGCSTVMLRRSAFADISMPLIRTGQDYGLWLKLLKGGSRAHAFKEVCTRYRILSNSISRNKFKKAKRQWKIYRDIEKISFFQSIYYFSFYAWRAVFRK